MLCAGQSSRLSGAGQTFVRNFNSDRAATTQEIDREKLTQENEEARLK
jgi:hypothetical protein